MKSDQCRANYGIDAPRVILQFLVIGTVGIAGGAVLLALGGGWVGRIAAQIVGFSLMAQGAVFVGTAGVMLWGSRVGKLQLRDRVMQSIEWRVMSRYSMSGAGGG